MRALFTIAVLLGSLGCSEQAAVPQGAGGGVAAPSHASSSGGNQEDRCATYVACTPPPTGTGSIPLALGSGKDCFLPTEANAALPIVSGPQGGYHVWVAVRTSGFGPTPTLSLRIHDDAGSLGLVDPMVRTLETCAIGNGVREQAHLFGFLAAQDPVAAEILVGTHATLDATLEDGLLEAAASLSFVFGDVAVDAHH